MNNVAIISGGMDSVTMLHQFKADIKHVLHFNYGSKHNDREREFARYNADKLEKTFTIVELPFINELFKSDLLKSGNDIPEGHYEDISMQRTVVPFRNGIMLSIAIGFCESQGGKKIYIANHAGDHAIYPDCRPRFIHNMNWAAYEGTYLNVEIDAPYITYSKREIANFGNKYGVDFTKTWTCYKGREKHCGKCGACTERREALQGFDPTEYEE